MRKTINSNKPTKRAASVANYLSAMMDLTGKTQKQIAEEVGYPRQNVISMIKNGDINMPLDKTPEFAKAIGADPAHLLMIALREYQPGVAAVIDSLLGREVVTEKERTLLKTLRELSPYNDLVAETEEEIEALKLFVEIASKRQALRVVDKDALKDA
ncbi:helix-turn-helix transcriptional regulator [Chromobacterium sp. ASV23]|uniref:helix-turn-helix domain-containing protein n=1 Tax=Chromobacterium sp. ASV23 TaxID=2795110 RepID=UPI0018ECFECA|nr:helix-turn-helix transcriptional regulator [Chromobacterium sp. ASV23]